MRKFCAALGRIIEVPVSTVTVHLLLIASDADAVRFRIAWPDAQPE